jgi:hypothetical protein
MHQVPYSSTSTDHVVLSARLLLMHDAVSVTLQVLPYDMNLNGNGVGISTAAPRSTGIANGDSIVGDQVGGTCKLSLRDYYSTPIACNAAENEVEAVVELLPDIGDVGVRTTCML